jgi:hypothetical protein
MSYCVCLANNSVNASVYSLQTNAAVIVLLHFIVCVCVCVRVCVCVCVYVRVCVCSVFAF